MATVRGYIYDELGLPVENATVVFPDSTAFALSHEDGFYQADGISNGTQRVFIVQRYYSKKVSSITVSGETQADFTLRG